jgi:hypothetical protein
MGSQVCSCNQSIVLLRDPHTGELRRVEKAGVKGNSTITKSGKIQDGTYFNASKCGVLQSHCRSMKQPAQGPRDDNGGRFGIEQWYDCSPALSTEQREPISESSFERCRGVKIQSGLLVSASLSTSDDGKRQKESRVKLSMRILAIAAFFGGISGVVSVLLSALPPNFDKRWKMLFEDNSQVELPKNCSQCPTVIFDRHGVVIATIGPGGYSYKQEDAVQRSLGMTATPAEIPSWMWQAVVATEDRRFFKHQGVDPKGLTRAVLSLTASGGGSTITQQVSQS